MVNKKMNKNLLFEYLVFRLDEWKKKYRKYWEERSCLYKVTSSKNSISCLCLECNKNRTEAFECIQ